jgi:ankyrin repeat protein
MECVSECKDIFDASFKKCDLCLTKYKDIFMKESANQSKLIQINPLYNACETGNFTVLKFLIEECNFDVNTLLLEQYSPLWLAAANGHLDCTKYLIERGANLNFQDKRHQETPLNVVVVQDADCVRDSADFFGCMKLLVDCGANVNIQDIGGNTPIYSADFEMTRYLVANGADLTIKNKHGETPLQHVIKQNYFDNSKKIEFLRSFEK